MTTRLEVKEYFTRTWSGYETTKEEDSVMRALCLRGLDYGISDLSAARPSAEALKIATEVLAPQERSTHFMATLAREIIRIEEVLK